MDFSTLLNQNFLDHRNMWNKIRYVCVHTGSRAVLSEPDIKPETDYDFMAEYSMDMEKFLTDLGFDQKFVHTEYMDFATCQVWVHPLENVQVVLKYPEHFQNCVKMWDVFKKNPSLFREYFWKSNPDEDISQNKIRMRIETFLKFLED